MPPSPASPPDTNQPAEAEATASAEAPAATGSSKAACIVLGETAAAPISDGRWPSARTSAIVPLPSASPPAVTAVPLTATLPVALAGAPPGENVSVWMRPPPPSSRSIVCVLVIPSIASGP